MTPNYERVTDRRSREERQLSIRAVHRDTPDVDLLTELLIRFSLQDVGEFKGKRLFFVYQGAAPTKMMIDDGEYSMSRFAGMYGFSYEGMATSKSEAKTLKGKLK